MRSHNAIYIIPRRCDNICAQCKGGWALESPRCERHVSCFVGVRWVLGNKSVRLRHKPNDDPACVPISGKIRVVAGFDNFRRSRSRAFSYAAEVSYAGTTVRSGIRARSEDPEPSTLRAFHLSCNNIVDSDKATVTAIRQKGAN